MDLGNWFSTYIQNYQRVKIEKKIAEWENIQRDKDKNFPFKNRVQ